jgi:EAL domain-containing protein (putative c-di-GMP-specific phosphodiesterase class I)
MIGKMNREIFSVKDIVLLADSQIPKSSLKKIMSGEDLSFLIKHAAMENAVNKGLAEKRFEVFYQPTYYLDDLRLHGAEALIRLRDEEMGLIFPDEFIPVAEQLDHIDEIDDFVLKEVCEFIKSGVPKEKGIETINVNLSVIECMRPGFVDHVIKIVNEAGVDKRWITFEITESLPSEDYAVLSRVISELKQRGFHFAMDDYGTGYSNMLSIFSIDFDLVKIDKSILWGAEKTELGRIILENSVRMIRQMNKKILVEGVETLGQIELLRNGLTAAREVKRRDGGRRAAVFYAEPVVFFGYVFHFFNFFNSFISAAYPSLSLGVSSSNGSP